MKQTFLPESFHSVEPTMTYEKLSNSYENNLTVTGEVLRLDPQTRTLCVQLGNNLFGNIPFEEATIYSTYKKNGSLSPYVYALTGKKIRAKIKCFSDSEIILSRKDNMLIALEHLKNQKHISLASITGFSKVSAFLDIGAGIVGKCYGRNFFNAQFSNAKDIGLILNDVISVDVISFSEYTNYFELSRVSALPPIKNVLKENDCVRCKVFGKPSGDNTNFGYFVGIYHNSFCGIVDSPYIKLKYGDEIIARIKSITPLGPRLSFISRYF